MAISTDAAVEFFGTTDAVDDGSTSAVNDNAMSAAADISAWTNDDDALGVMLILRWQYPSGTIDGDISIHVRPINVDGTDDPPVPTTTDPKGFGGSFEISTGQSATTDTVYPLYVPLRTFSTKTSQEYEFYLQNQSGVQMSANWDLDIIPKTVGPHP